ncbi:MAG TPA: hypothetical protein VJK53_01755 [Candidatus Paceibacterota bacterium]
MLSKNTTLALLLASAGLALQLFAYFFSSPNPYGDENYSEGIIAWLCIITIMLIAVLPTRISSPQFEKTKRILKSFALLAFALALIFSVVSPVLPAAEFTLLLALLLGLFLLIATVLMAVHQTVQFFSAVFKRKEEFSLAHMMVHGLSAVHFVLLTLAIIVFFAGSYSL